MDPLTQHIIGSRYWPTWSEYLYWSMDV